MPYRCVVLSMVLTIMLAIGCDNSSSPSKPYQTTASSPAIEMPPGLDSSEPTTKAAPPAATSDKVELKIATGAEIDSAVKAHVGKIVVLDIWATWCVPCKKEFHHLVELHQKHAKDGVQAMSVAWDLADDRGKALGFLTEKGATFPNFLLDRDETDTQKWLDAQQVKSIPVVLVFGRDGKLIRKFDGDDTENQFTYADVNNLVEELIKKK